MSGIGILDIETQLNSLKIKLIQKLLNSTNALWKNLMLYQLNLILNYIQGLALFDKNSSLGLLVTNIYKNRTMKISLFNYSMVAYILPVAISLPPRLLKESLDESHIFKSTVHTDNQFSYSMLPRKISDKFTIIYLGPLQMFTTMSNLLYNI